MDELFANTSTVRGVDADKNPYIKFTGKNGNSIVIAIEYDDVPCEDGYVGLNNLGINKGLITNWRDMVKVTIPVPVALVDGSEYLIKLLPFPAKGSKLNELHRYALSGIDEYSVSVEAFYDSSGGQPTQNLARSRANNVAEALKSVQNVNLKVSDHGHPLKSLVRNLERVKFRVRPVINK